MVIECSRCHARFKLADDKVKFNGTKVRCTKCREVFTVFPESDSPITTPVPSISPNVSIGEDGGDVDSFSTDTPPVSEDANWNQEINPSHFSENAGASDLDAINFENFATPVFSVSTEKNDEIKFTDGTDFSFKESSVAAESAHQYTIAEETDNKPVATESESGLKADLFRADPASTLPEVLSQNDSTTDSEFAFPAAENLTDFSWEESGTCSIETDTLDATPKVQTAPQDTVFDFSSFSFDDVSASAGTDENKNLSPIAESETTIELLTKAEALTDPLLTSPTSSEGLFFPLPSTDSTDDHQESRPISARQRRPRPRSREKKKGPNRLIFKTALLIFLLLLFVYGIMNRDQLQKEYKNKISGFIESQVSMETNGKIGLIQLIGSYLINNQGEDLFVIRGEAINEFKGLRSSVVVRGTIYDEKGAVIQRQSAYGGNPLPDNSLKKLGFKEIRDIMNKELGENLVNLNIASGKGIPFTIVFNKVPKNIKEFSVEVIESKPGSK